DGASFLTVSDLTTKQQGVPTQMLKYKPSTGAVAAPAVPGAAGPAPAKHSDLGWFAKLGLQDLLRLVGAVGVLGLLMVIGGIVGIRQARKRQPPSSGRSRGGAVPPYDSGPVAAAPTEALAPVPAGRDRRDGYEADPYAPVDPYASA